MPKKRQRASPLEKAIRMRRRVIKRCHEQQAQVRQYAQETCVKIQRKIDRETVLLEALERGALNP